MIGVELEDGYSGNGYRAQVTKIGQVVTAPFDYDDTVFKELAEINTAYNFYTPKTGKQFVITGIIAKADKQVSTTTDADVVLYEASSSSTTTADKVLIQLAMVEGDLLVMRLNILSRVGKYINGKTTDDDIHMTVMGYYIPEL